VSTDNFHHADLFVDLVLLIIFAVYRFVLSIIVLKIIAKNLLKSSLKGCNSYKESTDGFRDTDLFVDLVLLIIFAVYSFALSIIVFKIILELWMPIILR
jgi:hypothetical protein